MTTTAIRIIRGALDALSLRGAGQAVNGTIAADLLATLNTMLNGMNLGPTFAYQDIETISPLAANTPYLTIGPGLDLDIARPNRIEGSSFIRVGKIDYPLMPVDTDTFNSIVMKTLNGPWPVVCYWDGASPNGTVSFWPQGACEVHLITRLATGHFADLTTEYALPDGYERMFIFSLAEEAAPSLEVQVPASVTRIAQGARRAVQRNNLTIPQLDIPRISGPDGRYVLADFIAGF